jgi:ubiquinone/menaquinone biosynthesis C-methylase UbiE
LEYDQFVKYLKKVLPKGGVVLDVGCGVGLMLDAIARDCPNVLAYGIEFSNYAGQKAIEKGHNVRFGDITQMDDLKSNSMDAIIILYVLEHMQDPITALKKCYSLLKESGKIFIAIPNYRYLKLTHTGILAWLFYGKQSNLFPNEHLFNYTPKTITSILNKSGFDISYFGQAKPLKAGTFVQRLLKLVFSSIFQILFKCGYQLGGIHIIARKKTK